MLRVPVACACYSVQLACYNSLCIFVQDSSFLNAVAESHLKSLICNFHVIKAVKKELDSNPRLKLFMRPLIVVFKQLARSNCSADLDRMRQILRDYAFEYFPSW